MKYTNCTKIKRQNVFFFFIMITEMIFKKKTLFNDQ